MMTNAKKSKISWDYFKGKILATKEVKKISYDVEDEENIVLTNICFNKRVV